MNQKVDDEGFDEADDCTLSIPLDEIYQTKYKYIKESLWILGHFFQSKHVNFAMLKIYQEPLIDVVPELIKQLMDIPMEHIVSFTDLQLSTQFFFCGLFVSCPFMITELPINSIAHVFNIMITFLNNCGRQKSTVVGGMIIQEHSVLTRPLLGAFETLGKFWEHIVFQPSHYLFDRVSQLLQSGLAEISKRVWIEILMCAHQSVARWALCSGSMFSYVALLDQNYRDDLLVETSQTLRDAHLPQEKIDAFITELSGMFTEMIPLPGARVSSLKTFKSLRQFSHTLGLLVNTHLDQK